VVHTPLVSVIIVNWNGAEYLQPCLTLLAEQTSPPDEIIIVDNASTDHSAQVIEMWQAQWLNNANGQRRPALRLIRNARNEGFCRGNNQGIHAASGDFILLLNADVMLNPQFLANLISVLEADETVGIVVGKLLSSTDPSKIDSTGLVMHKTRRASDRGQGEDDTGQYQTSEEVFGASGAACLCRRSMLEEIKYDAADLAGIRKPGRFLHDEYFDELFFVYKEDVDLAWRARLNGWKCVYTPNAIGWHYRKWGTGKRKDIPVWIRRHSLKNRYLMLLKNERRETLTPHLWSILWYELRSLGYLLVREPALLTVISDIFRAWPEIMQKRQITQQLSRLQENNVNLRAWFH
jgi:GT2 family glycosyltransferase